MRRVFIAAALALVAAVPALGISRPSGSSRVAGAVLAERAGRVTAANITLDSPIGVVSGVGYQASAEAGATGLSIVFPEKADGAYAVLRGQAGVAFSVRGAASSAVEVSKGKVAYREIFPGVDAVHQLNGNRSEEFLVLKDERSTTEFTYDLDVASGVEFSRLPSGGMRFAAEGDDGDTLVIEAPYVVDATGRTSYEAARYEIDREVPGQATVRLTVDTAGLAFPLAVDPTWAATTPMSTARSQPSATRLSNGRVLVAGGVASGGVHSSCEIYNPTTASWASTGSLLTGRYGHAAVLLANGDVLAVAGQRTNGLQLQSVERWSVTSKTWSAVSPLAVEHEGLTATVLTDGRVLVVGGDSTTCELFNPATGTWVTTGSLAHRRRYHSAVRLNDGRVMVYGGEFVSAFIGYTTGTAELYNPASGTWSTVAAGASRARHAATLLADGRVFVAGGLELVPGPDPSLATAQIFNPATGLWSAAPSMAEGRTHATATLLSNGRVLVVGGQRSDSTFSDLSQAFDPATGTWKAPDTGGLVTGRAGHQATLLTTGSLLVTGGLGAAGALSSAEIR